MRFSNRWLHIGTALAATVLEANAQLPVITSLSQTGVLTCTNLVPGSIASVEWAPSVTGPWHTNWAGLDAVTVDSNGVIQVDVPMFYRVRGLASTNPPPGMVWIPPGTFVMGSPVTEKERGPYDETQHTVTLTKGFYMSKNLVTQAQYLALMGNNPSYSGTNPDGSKPVSPDLSRPVEQVGWYDATNYCGRLTASEQAAGRLPAGWVYRLPTEAEWEYACRAGTTTAFNLGPDLRSGMANFQGGSEYVSGIGTVVNRNGVALDRTTAVGSYPPNAWGLYDMQGNLSEWCLDLYGTYPVGSVTDPRGPATPQYLPGYFNYVFRGGGWLSPGTECRSAYRGWINPVVSVIYYPLGFRPVLAPGQ